MAGKLSATVSFFLLSILYSCKKDTSITNNPPNGSTGTIGQFSVMVLQRSQTTDTIRWTTHPAVPAGTTLKV